MKSFYGGTYIGKDALANNNIYHPIRLEYYKTVKIENYQSVYGIEVVKTEYKDDKINVENKIINKVTHEESTINKILEKLKAGEITPAVTEEMVEELLKAWWKGDGAKMIICSVPKVSAFFEKWLAKWSNMV